MMVSLIIPAFTDQATLDRTLGMLEPQRHWLHEVIVVDDGSDPPLTGPDVVRIERSPIHRSASFARNEGVRVATGDHFLFCDASIHIVPDAVQSIMAAMKKLHTVGHHRVMLTGRFVGLKDIDKDAHEHMNEWVESARSRGLITDEDEMAHGMPRNKMVNPDHQFALISRKLFEEVGGYDEEHFTMWGLECQDLTLRIIKDGGWVYSGVPRIRDGRRLLVFHEFHDANRDEENRNAEFTAKWGEPFSHDLIQRTIRDSDGKRPD